MKLNLNMKLSGNIGAMLKPLGKYLGLISIMAIIAILGYTAYFITNLFYAPGDLSALEKKQEETNQSKQVRFNEKTLRSLDQLKSAGSTPDTSGVGKQNPFSQN